MTKPMDDTISRQATIDAVTKYCLKYDLRELLADIECLPSAEKKGEWIPVVDGNYIVWECSECHVESDAWTDFCPICGSRNIEEMDDDVTYEEALEEFIKNIKTYTLGEVEAELGLTTELMLNSPITPEQWDLLEDVDFDHTDRIWFHTKQDKDVAFVKERKGKWINHRNDEGHNIADCDQCGEAMQWFDDDIKPNYCPNCGARMGG